VRGPSGGWSKIAKNFTVSLPRGWRGGWIRLDLVGLGRTESDWSDESEPPLPKAPGRAGKSDRGRLPSVAKAGTSGAEVVSVFISFDFVSRRLANKSFSYAKKFKEGGGTFTVLP